MVSILNKQYLDSSIKQFEYYKSLGDKTLQKIDESKLHWQFNNESNSIAIIVNHLYGNMLSRWTDFLTTDGEKTWRNRDQEFEITNLKKSDIIDNWNQGWECLLGALKSLKPADLEKEVYIRNEKHTVLEAIIRQQAHYAYHVGQIVYLGKMLLNDDWVSLSIPKNESQKFNDLKAADPNYSSIK